MFKNLIIQRKTQQQISISFQTFLQSFKRVLNYLLEEKEKQRRVKRHYKLL